MVGPDSEFVLSDDELEPEEQLTFDIHPVTQAVYPVEVVMRPSPRRTRTFQEFRLSQCLFFPGSCIPETRQKRARACSHHACLLVSLVVLSPLTPGRGKENPIEQRECCGIRGATDCANPQTTDAAESLMITENFWESVEMKQAIESSRIHRFSPGYSEVGVYRAIREQVPSAHASSPEATSLAFYLGPQTRLGMTASSPQNP